MSLNKFTFTIGVDTPTHGDTQRRSSPGILVLTSSMHLLFMNQEAGELCRLINRWQVRQEARGVVPVAVMAFCEETQWALQARTDVKDWEQFQLQRVVGDPDCPVLLRGFGLPDFEGSRSPLLLIIIEKVAHRKAGTTEQVKEQYHMTEREHTVLQHLASGSTNKEIALTLGISEQTVKEHVKHIMNKTRTNTRTGMLARLLLATGPEGAREKNQALSGHRSGTPGRFT
ncbi:MAG: LuxR C-terminal-related transcriptional regulator [Nitrospirales bacterium]